MNMKKIYKSKTLWLNIAMILIVVIDRVSSLNMIPGPTAALVLAVANMVLRMVTGQPIEMPLPKIKKTEETPK